MASFWNKLYTVVIVPLPIPHPSRGGRFGHGLNAAFARCSHERRSETQEAVHDAIFACRGRTAGDPESFRGSSREKHEQIGPPLKSQ